MFCLPSDVLPDCRCSLTLDLLSDLLSDLGRFLWPSLWSQTFSLISAVFSDLLWPRTFSLTLDLLSDLRPSLWPLSCFSCRFSGWSWPWCSTARLAGRMAPPQPEFGHAPCLQQPISIVKWFCRIFTVKELMVLITCLAVLNRFEILVWMYWRDYRILNLFLTLKSDFWWGFKNVKISEFPVFFHWVFFCRFVVFPLLIQTEIY